MGAPDPPGSSGYVPRPARFLLVDDDEVLLRTWRRYLHRQRPAWEVYTADGGEAALQQLAARVYDVLVTDLEMPEMDGFELLRIVAERHPQIVRVLYSGWAEGLDDAGAAHLHHLVLDKAASTEQFVAVLERALAYRLSARDLEQVG